MAASSSVVKSISTPRALKALVGVHRLAARVRGVSGKPADTDVDIGVLRAWSQDADDAQAIPGQWLLQLNLRAPQLHEALCRLGLLPIRWSAKFERALRTLPAMCLVADTNALYHGSLLQALALRGAKPTHVAIADQAMMELQRHREAAYGQSPETVRDDGPSAVTSLVDQGGPRSAPALRERLARTMDQYRRVSAIPRLLRRLRQMGHLVHVVAPPPAKVRYFGGSRSAGESVAGGEEESEQSWAKTDIVGSNALRDRLILEAVLQQRVELHGIPVWLVTDDALLAQQACLENFLVGFGNIPHLPESVVLTSPFFDPRTLVLRHVPLRELLEEVLSTVGTLIVQREERGEALLATIALERQVQARTAVDGSRMQAQWQNITVPVWRRPLIGGTASVAKLAPTPTRLLKRLRDLAAQAPDSTPDKDVDGYLRALGWIVEADGTTIVSGRGKLLWDRWARLTQAATDVLAWEAWIVDAAADVSKLSHTATILKTLFENPGRTDQELAQLAGEARRALESQLVLTNAFGLAVRLEGRNWAGGRYPEEEAKRLVRLAIETRGTPFVAVADVFAEVRRGLAPMAMPLPTFRGALLRLFSDNQIEPSGSSPSPGNSSAIRILLPPRPNSMDVAELKNINLRDGDVLLPGRSCAVVRLCEAP